jgi:MoaD family protein
MRVSVRFFTMLKEITGKKEETLTFQTRKPITVKQILSKLSKEYGKDFNEYVYNADTGDVRGFLQFLINGRSVSLEKNTKAELHDGDVLAIIPPVSGG